MMTGEQAPKPAFGQRFFPSAAPLPLAVLQLVFLLSGCTSVRISTEVNPNADFTGLRTYDWVGEPHDDTITKKYGPDFIDSTVREAVGRELARKGYRRVRHEAPDFLIDYRAALEEKVEVEQVDEPLEEGKPQAGWTLKGESGWDWADARPETYIREYAEGSLILDVIDPRTKRLLWRGSAETEINRTSGRQK